MSCTVRVPIMLRLAGPTVVQKVEEAHDTDARPEARGARAVQLEPLYVDTPPALMTVQNVEDVHETSVPPPVPDGVVHVEPLKIWAPGPLKPFAPSATQKVLEVQDRP